jgi:hypothetical protein
MTTRIDIVNRALVRIGASPLVAETDPGADARIMDYDSVVGALLTGYPWYWAQRTRQLQQETAAPASPHWQYQFKLPPDLGAPRAVYADRLSDEPTANYELSGAALWSNSATIWLRYSMNAPPAQWPPYFAEVVVLAIAAEFALSVREDHVLRDKLRNDVYGSTSGESGMLGAAKSVDSQAKPAPQLPVMQSPLIAVRSGRRR